MAKIVLGKRPTSFKKTVNFPMLDGSIASIEVTYRYRTRTEFGDFLDAWAKKRKERAAEEVAAAEQKHADGMGPLLESGALERAFVEAGADYIMEIAEGWNVDDTEFCVANVRQLADEIPAAAKAITDTYRLAITEGRLGN